MADNFEYQESQTSYENIAFNERLNELLDAQTQFNSDKRIMMLKRQAKLRYPDLFLEGINYTLYPGLKINAVNQLINCEWVARHHHLLIVGSTGTGKTSLACMLSQEAIKRHIPVLFFRMSHLLLELVAAQRDEKLKQLLRRINRAPLLVLDDWGNALMNKVERHLLFELIESRDQNASLLITSQYPVTIWHECFQDSTIADSVLDRIIHNAHKINLKGESIRKILSIKDGGES